MKERLTLAGLGTLSIALRAVAFFRYRFDSDEPQHLHVAWGWTAGLLQYRDVFDNHAPLFHILTAPLLSSAGERPDVLLFMRIPMLLLYAAVLASTWILGRRLYGPRVGIWAAVLLSLFPIFFLKSLEFRTDNLWTTAWMLALVAITGGPPTVARLFITGLLLGCALATSLKTIVLLLTLAAAAGATWWLVAPRPGWRRVILPGVALLGGLAIVPAAIGVYFAKRRAWSELWYCTVQFNELLAKGHVRPGIWIARVAYLPLLALLLWAASRVRPKPSDPARRWRFFVGFAAAFYAATLLCLWSLISPRDFLAWLPVYALFVAASVDRLDRRLLVYAALGISFAVAVWHYTGHLENGTEEEITMIRQVLGVSRPGDPIIDYKGETIYRQRPYYYILEAITRREIARGVIADTIPEDVIRARCHLAQADGKFWPARGRAFLRANFLDLGRIRAAGQWIGPDGSFTIAVPGEYVIVTAEGEARGLLDATPYRGRRELEPGPHRFTAEAGGPRLACLWAPAFIRGYSPFHLKDREFHGSPVFSAPDDDRRAAPGR